MAKGKAVADAIAKTAKTVERSADDWVKYAGKQGAKYAEQVGTETAASVISGIAMNGGTKSDVLRQMKNLNKGMADDAARSASQTMLSTGPNGQMHFGAFDGEMMAAERSAAAKAAKAPREAKVAGRAGSEQVYGQTSFIDKNGNFTGGPGSRARNAAPEAPSASLQERLEAYKAGKRQASSKENDYLRYKLEKEDMANADFARRMDEARQASSHNGRHKTREQWEASQREVKSGTPGQSRVLGDTEYTASDVYQRFNEHAQSWGYENAREMSKNVNVHNVDELQRHATPFRERVGMRVNNLKNTARQRIDNPRRFADNLQPEEIPGGINFTDNITNSKSARRILNNNNGQGVNITGSSKADYTYGFDSGNAGTGKGVNAAETDVGKIAKDNAETAALDNSGILDWMQENQALAAGVLVGGGLVAHGLLDND